MHKYIFDVTALRPYLARHSRLSGIQRVSVMTIARARAVLGAEHVWFGYHDRVSNMYKVRPCPTDEKCDLTNYDTLCSVLNVKRARRSLPGMGKYAKNPLKRQINVWLRDLQAKRGNAAYFQRRGLSLDEWQTARSSHAKALYTAQSSTTLERIASPGDRLVLLDNAWYPKGLGPCLRHAGTKMGLQVYVLLHDLIPLVTPQYVERDLCDRFYNWLVASTDYVSCYLANSEHTGHDLQNFLTHQKVSKPIHVVPLAQAKLSDTPLSLSTEEDPYAAFAAARQVPDYIRALTKTPYVLVVGTMEIRKNLWQLATVWGRLRGKTNCALPKLVLAGRRGWLNDDFDALMQATGRLGGWVEIVEEPDDAALSYLYEHCLFTITASFYEGWGLPIGESLAYGKTAVVSNTSSMPQVGGNLVEYCDPHCLNSIEAACLRLIDDPKHRSELEERILNTQLRTWDDVAQDMLNAICPIAKEA